MFAFESGGNPVVTVKADTDPLAGLDKRENLVKLKASMDYHYGPDSEGDEYAADANQDNDVPTGKYGPNDELKPGPSKPASKSAMSKNGDQDIEPGDTL